eukprot:TRINITY_DN8482_c0_g1_i5.p1 TRINITY_DN8482_c0_g1~~TRINITY_DN8482_c0_g1_i5.p1  ORF type:complete len:215 (+),score=-13.41 TRINITY_DN8482_c0_g1_i5:445-1089(+)
MPRSRKWRLISQSIEMDHKIHLLSLQIHTFIQESRSPSDFMDMYVQSTLRLFGDPLVFTKLFSSWIFSKFANLNWRKTGTHRLQYLLLQTKRNRYIPSPFKNCFHYLQMKQYRPNFQIWISIREGRKKSLVDNNPDDSDKFLVSSLRASLRKITLTAWGSNLILEIENACVRRISRCSDSFIFYTIQSHSPCTCLLYTSPSPRDGLLSRMPSSA